MGALPVQLPKYLGKQLLNQFRNKLPDNALGTPSTIEFFPSDEMLRLFDTLDKYVGLHWPLAATNLWQARSQILALATFETSKTILSALSGMMEGGTIYLPVFSSAYKMDEAGMTVRVRPTIDCTPRHWHIQDTLFTLGLTAIYKTVAPEEMKNIVFRTNVPNNEYSEVYKRLMGCEVHLDVPLEQSSTFYPVEFLRKRVGTHNKRLHKLLMNEIRKQAAYPNHEYSAVINLKKTLFNQPETRFTLIQAAEKIGVPPSTLKRYLSNCGETFTSVRDTILREQILIHLTQHRNSKIDPQKIGFVSQRALDFFAKPSST